MKINAKKLDISGFNRTQHLQKLLHMHHEQTDQLSLTVSDLCKGTPPPPNPSKDINRRVTSALGPLWRKPHPFNSRNEKKKSLGLTANSTCKYVTPLLYLVCFSILFGMFIAKNYTTRTVRM